MNVASPSEIKIPGVSTKKKFINMFVLHDSWWLTPDESWVTKKSQSILPAAVIEKCIANRITVPSLTSVVPSSLLSSEQQALSVVDMLAPADDFKMLRGTKMSKMTDDTNVSAPVLTTAQGLLSIFLNTCVGQYSYLNADPNTKQFLSGRSVVDVMAVWPTAKGKTIRGSMQAYVSSSGLEFKTPTAVYENGNELTSAVMAKIRDLSIVK